MFKCKKNQQKPKTRTKKAHGVWVRMPSSSSLFWVFVGFSSIRKEVASWLYVHVAASCCRIIHMVTLLGYLWFFCCFSVVFHIAFYEVVQIHPMFLVSCEVGQLISKSGWKCHAERGACILIERFLQKPHKGASISTQGHLMLIQLFGSTEMWMPRIVYWKGGLKRLDASHFHAPCEAQRKCRWGSVVGFL